MIHFGNQNNPDPQGIDLPQWLKIRPQFKQVHGVKIARIQQDAEACGEVDGIWTTRTQFPIGIVTADCVPVLLNHVNARGGVTAVAALHAGWRGIYDNILSSFFDQLPAEYQNPKAWIAHLGPSIRSCCYEVSQDLIDQFHARYPNMNRKELEPEYRRLNLNAVIQYQAVQLGVKVDSIHPDCTFCARDAKNEPIYFSYRRGDRCSRQYSTVWIDSLD